MIDWSKEIETVDGKPLVYLPERNTGANDFPRWVESPANSFITWFYSDFGKPWNPRNPDLRNVAQPAVSPTPDERAVALAKRFAQDDVPVDEYLALKAEARAIVAALEPVDGDLVIARGIMADLHPDMECHDLFVKQCMEGKHDTHDGVRAARAALARGRQLEKEGK